MKRARILALSTTEDTYANCIAALAKQYVIDEVIISFLDSSVDDELLARIDKRLAALGDITFHNKELSARPGANKEVSENSVAEVAATIYRRAARVKLSADRVGLDDPKFLVGCHYIDVTAVGKQDAFGTAARALQAGGVPALELKWIKQQDFRRYVPRIGRDEYSYTDLLSGPGGNLLRRDYIAKKHVLIVFATIFGLLAVTAVLQIVFDVPIPDKWINMFSLLIGVGGLQLAYVSLKK